MKKIDTICDSVNELRKLTFNNKVIEIYSYYLLQLCQNSMTNLRRITAHIHTNINTLK